MKLFSTLLMLFMLSGPLALADGSVTPLPDEDTQTDNGDQGDGANPGEGDDWDNGDQGDQDDGGYPGDGDQNDDWDDGDQGDDGYGKDDERDQGPGRPQHPHRPGRMYSEIVPVKNYFYGFNRFPLYMLTRNLPRLQGYALKAIVVNGYSEAGMGGGFFCSSFCSQIQPVGGYPGSYVIHTLGDELNEYSANWFLELRGNFAVDSFRLEYVRVRGGHGRR